jgi:hypothetical protein
VGPAPIIEIVSPEAPAILTEGERFSATATVSHSESVRLTWSSDLDGDLKTRTIRAGGESTIEVASLTAGIHQISATGLDSIGVPGWDSVEVEVWGIPTAPEIKLNPDPAFAGDELRLVLIEESVDPQGGAVVHRIEWRVDGQVFLKDSKIIPASTSASGEVWEVLVWGETSTQKGHVSEASVTVGGFVGWGDRSNSFSVADSLVRGEQENDLAGTTLSMGCDLDGDGLDDLLVGTPNNDEGGSNAGRTYVVRGAEMSSSSQVDTYSLKESLVGAAAGDLSGSALACGGDVDGDGRVDMLVGSPGTDSSRGRVHLVMGDEFSGDFDLMDSYGVLDGENQGDLIGTALGFAGDVDGDGLEDVLVGAWANDDVGVFSGKVYLISGASLSGNSSTNLTDAEASWIGEDSGNRAGHAVAGLGDVDGDGLDDVGFGAYGFDDNGLSSYLGAVYVGLSSSGLTPNQSAAQADIVLFGEDTKHYAGYALSGHGDVDGDGLDDFLVSALGYNSSTGGGGAVYLVLASDLQKGTMSLADVSYVFEGETVGDNVGRSLVSAGDVDRDGFPDILIGAPSVDKVEADGGQAYLILDADIGTPGAMSLERASYIFTAVNDKELAGRQVASGDFNGDGMMDLAVGAPNAGNTMLNRGHTYLLFAP